MSNPAPRSRQILAAVIGNAFEWYDFVVYGFVSSILARVFFPPGDETVALLLTFATFGAGFFTRPLGGIVLGILADRRGRKAAMQLILLLMTLAVAILAIAPTYAAIGVGAPLLVLAARLMQGFSAGGEYGSATSFLIEVAPAHQRGFYGSLQMVGQGVSALCASAIGALLSRNLDAAQMDSWGWRVPFLLGLLIGPVGYYIRRRLDETPEFLALRAAGAARPGIAAMLRDNRRGVATSFLLTVCGTTAYYIVLLYMPTFAKTQLGLPLADAFEAQVAGLALLVVLTAAFGRLSDLVGRRILLRIATAGYLVLPWPLLSWALQAPSFERLLGMQLVLCSVVALFFGSYATALAEQFPAGVRSTAMGIAYNFAVLFFGAFAPFLVTWLIRETGSPVAPAFYVMFGAVAGIVATTLMAKET